MFSPVSSNDMSTAGLEEVLAFMRETEAQPLHVTHVTHLALQLFDSLAALHGLGDWERGLLETAGYLHDIGHQFDHLDTGHHLESARMIREHPWKSFPPLDANLAAQVARYHRKSPPKMKHEEFAVLSPPDRLVVQKLAALLRIADALDRSHEQHISRVTADASPDKLTFHLEANGPVLIEVLTAQMKGDLAREVFQRELVFMLGEEVIRR
jgi:exopolyphosphatase/guanosine-5'-triphosphate,3'-diphosphate pyrophosphatase